MHTIRSFSPHHSTLPSESLKQIQCLLESGDLETLFRGGCCYQWALRIYRDRLPKAFVTLATHFSPEAKQTHVYLKLSDGRCIDVCKVFETERELWDHWIKPQAVCQTEFLSTEWLDAKVRSRLPGDLTLAVMRAALEHFDIGDAFKSVREQRTNGGGHVGGN